MTATKTNPGMKRSLISALTAALIAITMLIGGGVPALAQQGTIASPPPIVMPGSQGKETSTLELPSMPAPQGGDSLNIPPQAPQTGQSLRCQRASCASSRVTSKSR